MHIRFEDKTLIAECRRQPDASIEDLAHQLGVSEKRVKRLRNRIRRTDNPKTYFIADQRGRVKIGKSIEPIKRFKALQSANPDPLTLLGICDDEEGEIHSLFADLRLVGEWFALADTLRTWIQENAEVPEMPS